MPDGETAFTPEHGEVVPFGLILNVSTNGKSMIMFQETEMPEAGRVVGFNATVDVLAPALDNLTSREVRVPLVYHAPEVEWGTDNYTIEAQLMSYDDPSQLSTPISFHWNFTHIPDEEDTGTPSGKSPGPDVVILSASVVAAFVMLRRKEHS